MRQNTQKGGTFASDDLCHNVGQKGFDSLGVMQTNKMMAGGQAPNLVLPDSSAASHAPTYINTEPSHIIPADLTQQAIYPLYYSTNYAPLLQIGAGRRGREKAKRGVWASPQSPRP